MRVRLSMRSFRTLALHSRRAHLQRERARCPRYMRLITFFATSKGRGRRRRRRRRKEEAEAAEEEAEEEEKDEDEESGLFVINRSLQNRK